MDIEIISKQEVIPTFDIDSVAVKHSCEFLPYLARKLAVWHFAIYQTMPILIFSPNESIPPSVPDLSAFAISTPPEKL